MELNILGLAVLGVVIAVMLLGGSLMVLNGRRSPGGLGALLNALIKTGWLLPFCICAVFFGAWLVEIVIPTLKGANFNELYDLHGIRYLDITLVSFVAGFVWLAFVAVQGALHTRLSPRP